MKNTRIIAKGKPSKVFELYDKKVSVQFSDLNFDQWGLYIYHAKHQGREKGYLYNGEIKIENVKGQVIGQIHYKIPEAHSILYISYVMESFTFNLKLQKMILHNLIKLNKTESVVFASKKLAVEIAKDYETEAQLAKSKQYWGFALPR